MVSAKRVVEHVAGGDTGYRIFWHPNGQSYASDFQTLVASRGGAQYIRHYIQHSKPTISPYYRGLLFIYAVDIPDLESYFPAKRLSLISWLIPAGADVLTQQIYNGYVCNPASMFSLTIMHQGITQNDRIARRATDVVRSFLPLVKNSMLQYLLTFYPVHE